MKTKLEKEICILEREILYFTKVYPRKPINNLINKLKYRKNKLKTLS